jgi:hypothetical protein
MTESKTLPVIKLVSPNFSQDISIGQSWFEKRDKLLSEFNSIGSITNQDDFEHVEILLKKIGTTSSQAEKKRKELSDPYTKFAKKIKSMGDDARKSLEVAKINAKKLMGDYIQEQEKIRQEAIQLQIKQEEEQRQAQEKRNQEIQRLENERLQKQAELEKERLKKLAEQEKAIADADDDIFGFAEVDTTDYSQPIEVEAPAPSPPEVEILEPAVIFPDVIQKTISRSKMVWKHEIINPELVPRRFCSVDESKIRNYLKVEQGGATISGVKFFQELQVQSR